MLTAMAAGQYQDHLSYTRMGKYSPDEILLLKLKQNASACPLAACLRTLNSEPPGAWEIEEGL